MEWRICILRKCPINFNIYNIFNVFKLSATFYKKLHSAPFKLYFANPNFTGVPLSTVNTVYLVFIYLHIYRKKDKKHCALRLEDKKGMKRYFPQ